MSSTATKKFSHGPDYDFTQLSHQVSKYKRFNTNEYVTKFIIQDLGVEQMENLAIILRQIIDHAYENAHAEYGSDPYFYVALIHGQGLNDPVRVKATRREEDHDILMVISLSFMHTHIFTTTTTTTFR